MGTAALAPFPASRCWGGASKPSRAATWRLVRVPGARVTSRRQRALRFWVDAEVRLSTQRVLTPTRSPWVPGFGFWGGFGPDQPRRRSSFTRDPLAPSCSLPDPPTPSPGEGGTGSAPTRAAVMETGGFAAGNPAPSPGNRSPNRRAFRRTLNGRRVCPSRELPCRVGHGARGGGCFWRRFSSSSRIGLWVSCLCTMPERPLPSAPRACTRC